MAIRLNFVVEGQTEEAFVKQILSPYLAGFEVWVQARCVLTSRRRNIIDLCIFKGIVYIHLYAT